MSDYEHGKAYIYDATSQTFNEAPEALRPQVHNHFHPTSDQVLKAVGDIVTIEPHPLVKLDTNEPQGTQRVSADGDYARRFPGGDGSK